MQGHSGPDVLIQQAGLELELGLIIKGRSHQNNGNDDDDDSNSHHLLLG